MATKRYAHTVIIGIDGMGSYNRDIDTPNLDSMFANGATNYSALSMDPTISAENWGAMLIGANPSVHCLTNSIVDRFEYKNKELPTIFTRIRKEYPDSFLAACSNWNPINYGIIEHDIDVEFHTAKNDDELTDCIEEVISRKPDLLFIQFDDVDGAGHHYWYGSPGFREQVQKTDGYVGRIAKAYKDAGIYDDTLFICLADHGGIRAGHGGYTKEERTIFFSVAGKGTETCRMGFAQTKDVAAIVLYAFGIDIPEYNKLGFSSQVPDNIFKDRPNDYIQPAPVENFIETRPTPAIDGENGLYSFFDKDSIKLAMFFDDATKDETEKNKFTEIGRIKYYSTGVNGARGEFGKTGYAVTDDLKFGTDSFTVACWLRLDRSLSEEVCVCSTQDWYWRRRNSQGFTLQFRDGDTRFSLANGKDDFELTTPYHDEVSDGWIHCINAIDKEKKEIRVYHNFKLVRACPIADDFLGCLDGLPFTVGNDAAHQHNDKEFDFIFNMDDLFIFNKAFDGNDSEKLKAYYGM